MKPNEVIDLCLLSGVLVGVNGANLKLSALVDSAEVPSSLVALCRGHKPDILAYLRWAEQADALLLESTGRLAAAWVPGCHLDTPEWETHEQALHEAYWSGGLDRLKNVLRRREEYALDVFERYRSEVHNV